jgi:hypothetical protein
VWFFIGLYAVLSLLLFDPKLFIGGDNAVYLNLAQSLIQGKGYRNLNQPGEPGHTQYPPAFPALLGLLMLGFGKNFIVLKLFIMLCGIAAYYLFYLIGIRIFKEKSYIAMAAYLLIPLIIYYNHWILSEIPFLLANLATVYFMIRAEEGKKGFYYPAFICANLAFFIRTTGIALIGAVLAYLLVRRKFREALIFAGMFLVLVIPWTIRNSHYSQTGGYLDQFLAKNFYQPNLGRIGVLDFFLRIGRNSLQYFFSILPQSLFSAIGAAWLLVILGVISLFLLGYGFFIRRREWSIFEFYLLFGLAVLLIWPEIWSSDRFLLPLLPILLIYIMLGLIRLSSRIRYLLPALGFFFILVNLWAIATQTRTAVSDNLQYLRGDRYAGYSVDWRRYFEAIDWIDHNVPDDQVIMARKPEFVYLLSGHKSFVYPYTTDFPTMRQSIDQADYILIDQFLWTGHTARYLIPALKQEPNRYGIVYQSSPPEFLVLKIKK